MISINRLLMLQIVYCFLGVMYNVGSLFALRAGEPAWATTDPLLGVVSMSFFGLFLSTGLLQKLALYRALMAVAVLAMGYGGVVAHLLNVDHLALYQSAWTWAGAIAVNGFGLSLNVIAALGWFVGKEPE